MIEDTTFFPPSPFFRFSDEATGMAALSLAGFIREDEDGNKTVITNSHTHALDVIGSIYRGGEWNHETGEVIISPTLLEGWHVNYLGELPEGWEQYTVFPANPSRIFL